MSELNAFLDRLRSDPDSVLFEEVMDLINQNYLHQPVAFKNGTQSNSADQNQGSARVFGFARIQGLTEQETLHCFGQHYRSVLADPEGTDHGNIRAFMKTGWAGLALPECLIPRH